MLQYILEVTLCWALFYLIFFGLLRKLTFFSVNRWYLLGSLILGMLIPQLRHMELNMYQQEISETIPLAIMVKELPAQVAVTVEEVTIEWYDILADVLWGVYIIGLVFFGFRLLRSLYRIYRLHIDGRQEPMEGANIVYTQSEHLPFSFWNTVYISDRVELSEEFQDILEHERTHVKSRHSIDVLLIELIQITFWFNPMIYLYKTALRQTHEYLADAAVLQHTSRKTYGTMLLKQSLSGLEIALTHQFFHSHIKKRINMMYKKKSGRSAWLKYALALPVLFVLTVVFANHANSEGLRILTLEDFEVLTDVDEAPYFKVESYNEKRGDRLLYSTSSLALYLFNQLSSDPIIFEQIKDQRAQITMTIKSDSKLSNISIKEGINKEVDQMMIDYLEGLNSNAFVPAKKGGENVDSDFVFSFQFPKYKCKNGVPCKVFSQEALQAKMTAIAKSNEGNNKAMSKAFEGIVKEQLIEYPDDHEAILHAVMNWGFENGYHVNPRFDKGITKAKGSNSVKDVNSLSIRVSTLNRHSLYVGDYTEDYTIMTKETVKEYLDMLITGKVNNTEALEDFIHFSYALRYNQNQIDEVIQLYQEVLEEEELDVYDEFEKVEISTDQSLPAALLAKKDIDLDDPSMPIIWTREFTISQPLTSFVDLDKPIKAIYYLPPSEATQVFGDDGSNGFYALMGYEWPISHPQKQRELVDFEMENFFKTLANDVNEEAWIDKLKEIHKKMQQRYPRVGDWITPFTTKAHKYNINLVIKDREIIKAYRSEEGEFERIDRVSTSQKEDLDATKPINEPEEYKKSTSSHSQSPAPLPTPPHTTEHDVNDPGKIYKVVQQMPRFPGCELMSGDNKAIKACADEKLLEYLYRSVKYPAEARENKIEGRVYIQFVVEKDGTISNSKIVRDIGSGCGAAALKVVDMMNELYERWTPGVQQGETVRVLYTLPVTFKLDDESDAVNPLFLLDGHVIQKHEMEDMDPGFIKEIYVLKGESAKEKYGEKGINGVVEIITKKGNELEEKGSNVTVEEAQTKASKNSVEFLDPNDFSKTISLRTGERLKVFNDRTTIELEGGYYKIVADYGHYHMIDYYPVPTDLKPIPPPPPPADFQHTKRGSKRIDYYLDGVKVDRSTIQAMSSTDIQSVVSYHPKVAKDLFNEDYEVARVDIATVQQESLENDTLIIFDPVNFTETIYIREKLANDFNILLTYKGDQVTLKSDHAAWKKLSFSLEDGGKQIIDSDGLAQHVNHATSFSFEISKNGNDFDFKSHHGFNWVELGTHCKKWIFSNTEITKGGVEISCF